MFLITFLVMNTANNKKQLALNVKQAQSLAQQHNCQLVPLDFQQENGMVSCLPLGLNKIRIQRGLTTPCPRNETENRKKLTKKSFIPRRGRPFAQADRLRTILDARRTFRP